MKKIIFILLLCLFGFPKFIFADGGLFPGPDYYIYETGQKAVIFYDDQKETMVISTSFQGDAIDFSWIVPTPTRPEVSKVSKDIFTNLENLTRIENIIYPMTQKATFGAKTMDVSNEVTVLEQKTIGYYDITLLESTNKNALFDWFKENNYTFPEQGKYILDDYIRLGWVFTAVKINEEALLDIDLSNNLRSGEISPLKFVFTSENLVYPLRITSIGKYSNANLVNVSNDISSLSDSEIASQPISYYPEQSVPITLYVFADHKKKLTDYSTIYANWIKSDEINNLAHDENGNSWVNADKKYFLTKMTNYLSYSQMEDDLYPTDDSDNKLVGVQSEWEKIIYWIQKNIGLIILILFLFFYVPIIWQFRKTSKTCHAVCWSLQVISFILLNLPTLALTYYLVSPISSPFTGYSYYLSSVEMGIILFLYAIPVSMLIILIIEAFWQRKNT